MEQGTCIAILSTNAVTQMGTPRGVSQLLYVIVKENKLQPILFNFVCYLADCICLQKQIQCIIKLGLRYKGNKSFDQKSIEPEIMVHTFNLSTRKVEVCRGMSVSSSPA